MICDRKISRSRTCGTRMHEHIDRIGRVTFTCLACERTARGICRECPAPVTGRARWCAPCGAKRQAVLSAQWIHVDPEHKRRRYRQQKQHRQQAHVKAARNARKRAWYATPEGKRQKAKYHRKYVLGPSRERYLEYHRAYNAQPGRAEAKRAHALRRYYEQHPTRPAPTCRDCGAPIPWTPPGRPPVRCNACVPPSVAARRRKLGEANVLNSVKRAITSRSAA